MLTYVDATSSCGACMCSRHDGEEVLAGTCVTCFSYLLLLLYLFTAAALLMQVMKDADGEEVLNADFDEEEALKEVTYADVC